MSGINPDYLERGGEVTEGRKSSHQKNEVNQKGFAPAILNYCAAKNDMVKYVNDKQGI